MEKEAPRTVCHRNGWMQSIEDCYYTVEYLWSIVWVTCHLKSFLLLVKPAWWMIQDNLIHPLRKLNVCHIKWMIWTYKKLHQWLTFSLFQITIHSYIRPRFHSQTFLHFTPASLSLHPHPLPMLVAFICLLVDWVSEWLLEWTTVCVRMAVGMNDCVCPNGCWNERL